MLPPSVMVLSSRRAKRAGWPKGLKGPEGTFRPFGPVGALRRRLLHQNGTFVPPAPSTPLISLKAHKPLHAEKLQHRRRWCRGRYQQHTSWPFCQARSEIQQCREFSSYVLHKASAFWFKSSRHSLRKINLSDCCEPFSTKTATLKSQSQLKCFSHLLTRRCCSQRIIPSQ